MNVLDYKLVLLALIGLGMGACISMYVNYYGNSVLRGVNKPIAYAFGLSIFPLLIGLAIISTYILNSSLFEPYNTQSGRTMFMLLWIIPFLLTAAIKLMQIIKHRRQ